MQRVDATTPEACPGAALAAAACLKSGGVIVAPTETVYGLMTLWGNPVGRDRLFVLKNRPREKHLQMLARDVPTAVRCGVEPSPALARLASRFWPGPLTLVCGAGGEATIGLRIPDHAFIQALLALLDEPLAATSANLSGEPAARDAESAVAGLCGEPDLLVDGGRVAGAGSTVASIATPHLEVLRPGPISREALLAVWSA